MAKTWPESGQASSEIILAAVTQRSMLYLVMKTRGPSTDLFAILAFCFVAPGLLDAATMSASARKRIFSR